LKQNPRIRFRKAGRGFVKDQEPRLANQTFAYFDQLLLGDGQIADDGIRMEFDAEFIEDRGSFAFQLFSINKNSSQPGFQPKENVFCDGEVR
jgi:hypothetical protein